MSLIERTYVTWVNYGTSIMTTNGGYEYPWPVSVRDSSAGA